MSPGSVLSICSYHRRHVGRRTGLSAARQSGWKWSDNQDERISPGL
jgi:hypothetical protein